MALSLACVGAAESEVGWAWALSFLGAEAKRENTPPQCIHSNTHKGSKVSIQEERGLPVRRPEKPSAIVPQNEFLKMLQAP